MKLTGAEIVIRSLEAYGITTISGIPGGSNLPLYDALSKSGIRHILARHEQGAGFIAQGMARTTGKPAVCFATSGPGATNLLSAIADAKADSVPVIAITGQVPTTHLGSDAFQEIDIYQMTIPITKHNFLVRKTEDLPKVMSEAFTISCEGRPGPVLIDIPKDIQMNSVECEIMPIRKEKTAPAHNEKQIQHALSLIRSSKRPVIFAGGGFNEPERSRSLIAFAHAFKIPVTLSLMGLGAVDPDDPHYLGMIGMHGTHAANTGVAMSDLLIALGVRFDDRVTGSIESFAPHAKIIHIDIDESELGKIHNCALQIKADAAKFIDDLTAHSTNEAPFDKWVLELNEKKAEYDYPAYDKTVASHAVSVLKTIDSVRSVDSIIVTDVGQHQMWSAQTLRIRKPRTFLTSGGLGTMGFGLPTAIGAAITKQNSQIICITGDGSIMMNIQELATLAELGLTIKILILNNGHLGLVRQQQELFYNGNIIASKFEHRCNFASLAHAFGIRGIEINGTDVTKKIMHDLLSSNEPLVADIHIAPAENVFPMVPPGKANTDMIHSHKKYNKQA